MIKATFTDGTALYYAVPAQSNQDGLVIVQVKKVKNQLVVTHACSFNKLKSNAVCMHNQEAVELYREWRWWDRYEKIVYQSGKVVLQADWEVIHTPNSIDAILSEVNSDVAFYH
ncbi:MAG TPA: hypothetical protein VNM69_02280 [Bacillus sp. (in: firmicutes)]|nr:hypothetical protein [Bacillus sp. (in: firmicutes)]